jgi:hypothetical protein
MALIVKEHVAGSFNHSSIQLAHKLQLQLGGSRTPLHVMFCNITQYITTVLPAEHSAGTLSH